MKALLLLLLVGGLGGYVLYQRHQNYPMESVTTPAGASYEIRHLPDECLQPAVCVKRVIFLSSLRDSSGLRNQAEGLLPWVDGNITKGAGPHALVLVALEPGFLKMGAPKHMTGLVFTKVPGMSWTFLHQEDMTSRLAPMFE